MEFGLKLMFSIFIVLSLCALLLNYSHDNYQTSAVPLRGLRTALKATRCIVVQCKARFCDVLVLTTITKHLWLGCLCTTSVLQCYVIIKVLDMFSLFLICGCFGGHYYTNHIA